MSKTDKNYYSIADQNDVRLEDVTIDPRKDNINPSTIDDVLKLSHATNVVINNVTVDAGGKQKENTLDMNRECKNITISNCILVSGQQNAITIKGGCDTVLIENVVIVPGTGHCDIELGNWSDQSQKKVTNVILKNVTRLDKKPVRLRVGHATNPKIIGGNVKRKVLASLIIKIYWRLKKIGLPI
jgi:polygalacturonase